MPLYFKLYDWPILTSYLEVYVVILRLHTFLQQTAEALRYKHQEVSCIQLLVQYIRDECWNFNFSIKKKKKKKSWLSYQINLNSNTHSIWHHVHLKVETKSVGHKTKPGNTFPVCCLVRYGQCPVYLITYINHKYQGKRKKKKCKGYKGETPMALL